MSFNAIESITREEAAARETIAQAQARARAMVAEAGEKGRAGVEAARAMAADDRLTLLSKIDEQIKEDDELSARDAKNAVSSLRVRATAHMDDAVALIIERIVNG